jgi:hypothetical protein
MDDALLGVDDVVSIAEGIFEWAAGHIFGKDGVDVVVEGGRGRILRRHDDEELVVMPGGP